MADGKQVSESGGKVVKVEIPMDTESETENLVNDHQNDKIFRREISFPGDISDSNSDSVFSPTISATASSFRRKSSSEINTNTGGITACNRMRPKSTSSCRSSSISDDDRTLQLSPHLHGKRPRTYSDSLNVDCSASPSPSPVSILFYCWVSCFKIKYIDKEVKSLKHRLLFKNCQYTALATQPKHSKFSSTFDIINHFYTFFYLLFFNGKNNSNF